MSRRSAGSRADWVDPVRATVYGSPRVGPILAIPICRSDRYLGERRLGRCSSPGAAPGLRGLVLPFAPEEQRVRSQRLPTSLQRAVVCAPRHTSDYGANPPPYTYPGLSPARRIRPAPLHPLPSTATGASNPPVAVPRTDRNGGHCPSQKLLLGQDNRRDRQVGIHDPQSPNSRPWVRDWQIMVAGGWQIQPAPRANLCWVAVKTVAQQHPPNATPSRMPRV